MQLSIPVLFGQIINEENWFIIASTREDSRPATYMVVLFKLFVKC